MNPLQCSNWHSSTAFYRWSDQDTGRSMNLPGSHSSECSPLEGDHRGAFSSESTNSERPPTQHTSMVPYKPSKCSHKHSLRLSTSSEWEAALLCSWWAQTPKHVVLNNFLPVLRYKYFSKRWVLRTTIFGPTIFIESSSLTRHFPKMTSLRPSHNSANQVIIF